jgi:hypothetical protein
MVGADVGLEVVNGPPYTLREVAPTGSARWAVLTFEDSPDGLLLKGVGRGDYYAMTDSCSLSFGVG